MIEIGITVKLPTYALSYLINGDSSGITEEAKIALDKFTARYYRQAEQVKGQVNFCFESGDEEYFTWSPAFGSACNVRDVTIIILY